MKTHYQVLVIGGGTAGIMTSSQLKKANSSIDIGLIEPSDTHYYHPAWTLVGANTYNFEDTKRPMSGLIPKGVDWIKTYADKLDPDNSSVHTRDGKTYTYDYLVVSTGIKIDPTLVEGLTEAMDKGVVCSNYTNPKHTWDVLKNFKGGTALFTQPTTPIKCGGAPQKIMYLAEDHFKKTGIRSKTDIVFATPKPGIFPVKPIAKTLMEVIDRKNIAAHFGHNLVAVDGKEQIAWYEMSADESYHNKNNNVGIIIDGDRRGIRFDMMHLAPPQTAPDFVKDSPLANAEGWLAVDSGTLQSTTYRNVFGLGDSAGLPTSKTGAAVRKQVPVVVDNLQRLIEQDKITDKQYNGYTSCPLVTGYGKMVLAEFDYDKNFQPDPKLKRMLVFNSDKEHWRLWMLKKYILPYLYWNKMMKGERV